MSSEILRHRAALCGAERGRLHLHDSFVHRIENAVGRHHLQEHLVRRLLDAALVTGGAGALVDLFAGRRGRTSRQSE
jgi:hypothetical protein